MFEFRTRLDKSKITKYEKFLLRKNLIYFILIGLLIVILGVGNIINGKLIFGIVITVLGTLYVPSILLYYHFFSDAKNLSSYVDHPNLVEVYTFTESEIKLLQYDNDNFETNGEILYENISKLYITKTDYVFYFSRGHIHFIPKNSFLKGDCKEFENFITKKMNKRVVYWSKNAK